MAKKFTHKCIECGAGYNSCFRCPGVPSYRNICCSPQCFQKYIGNTETKDNSQIKKEVKMHLEEFPLIVDNLQTTGNAKTNNKQVKKHIKSYK